MKNVVGTQNVLTCLFLAVDDIFMKKTPLSFFLFPQYKPIKAYYLTA